MSKSNKQIGACCKCGKIHEIPDDKDWRFKCDNCGAYRIFINQNIEMIPGESYAKRFICGECKGTLLNVGMGDGLGYGIDIFKCNTCDKTYIAICY